MATKKKHYSDPDGDSAHWESAREKERAMKAPSKSGIYVQKKKGRPKKISESDSGRTAKYLGERKATRKKIVTTKR